MKTSKFPVYLNGRVRCTDPRIPPKLRRSDLNDVNGFPAIPGVTNHVRGAAKPRGGLSIPHGDHLVGEIDQPLARVEIRLFLGTILPKRFDLCRTIEQPTIGIPCAPFVEFQLIPFERDDRLDTAASLKHSVGKHLITAPIASEVRPMIEPSTRLKSLSISARTPTHAAGVLNR